MADETPDSIQRWTAKRRVALVVSILKGDTSVAEAARTHGLTVAEVEDWRDRFLRGAENALRRGRQKRGRESLFGSNRVTGGWFDGREKAADRLPSVHLSTART